MQWFILFTRWTTRICLKFKAYWHKGSCVWLYDVRRIKGNTVISTLPANLTEVFVEFEHLFYFLCYHLFLCNVVHLTLTGDCKLSHLFPGCRLVPTPFFLSLHITRLSPFSFFGCLKFILSRNIILNLTFMSLFGGSPSNVAAGYDCYDCRNLQDLHEKKKKNFKAKVENGFFFFFQLLRPSIIIRSVLFSTPSTAQRASRMSECSPLTRSLLGLLFFPPLISF